MTARAVTVTERRALQTALERVDLTREEELVLRLRHGITAPQTTRLEFRGQDDQELCARLALMEAELIDQMAERAARVPEAEGQELERAIIDSLREI